MSLRLTTDLDACWLKRVPHGFQHVGVPRSEADGVMFLCPVCYAEQGSNFGVHFVICWFVGRVPDDETPGPGRWHPDGDTLDTLTFVGPSSASVLLTSSKCKAHFFIRNGGIE
jgi:hypothetical protein